MHCWALIQAFLCRKIGGGGGGGEKSLFLLNLIIASAERGLEVFLSIAEKQQQEHGRTAKMSKEANF